MNRIILLLCSLLFLIKLGYGQYGEVIMPAHNIKYKIDNKYLNSFFDKDSVYFGGVHTGPSVNVLPSEFCHLFGIKGGDPITVTYFMSEMNRRITAVGSPSEDELKNHTTSFFTFLVYNLLLRESDLNFLLKNKGDYFDLNLKKVKHSINKEKIKGVDEEFDYKMLFKFKNYKVEVYYNLLKNQVDNFYIKPENKEGWSYGAHVYSEIRAYTITLTSNTLDEVFYNYNLKIVSR